MYAILDTPLPTRTSSYSTKTASSASQLTSATSIIPKTQIYTNQTRSITTISTTTGIPTILIKQKLIRKFSMNGYMSILLDINGKSVSYYLLINNTEFSEKSKQNKVLKNRW
jgi:hypothetical protein